MILKALCDLSEEQHLSDDLDFMMKPVRYQAVVNREGQGWIVDMATLDSADGPRKARLLVPPRRIPRQSGRTSGNCAEFLVDKCDYVFGCNPAAGEGVAASLPERAALFKQRVDALATALVEGSKAREAASAIQRFLGDPEARRRAFVRKWEECSDPKEQEALTRGLFELVYEPLAPTPLHEISEIKAYWRSSRAESPSEKGQPSRCLVTGRVGVPTEKHPVISGVPNTLSSRSSLVSFNAEAFESYGLSRNENAPISRDSAESYVNALNWLLGKGPTGQNIHISSDSVVVFWAKGGGADWVRDGLDGDSPESVRHTLHTPQSGRRAALDDASAFYSIVLSGAQGRCVVRSFIETTVAEAARAMIAYLDNTAVERPYGNGVGNYRLRELVDSVGVEGRKETVVAADLTTRLYLAALRGLPFPTTVLAAAVRRNKAEAADDEKKKPSKWHRFAARAALVRAVLKRNQGMEVDVTLDRQNSDPAYLLGRLFATLDRIQQDALGQVNATTAERYYGAASSTPASVFPTLLRRSQHHLAKLSREKAGLAVLRDKALAEIVGGLHGFKRTMTLPEQGLFALGFHHQRQSFFQKKEEEK
jgi:CRISPR-associated protein Csd1